MPLIPVPTDDSTIVMTSRPRYFNNRKERHDVSDPIWAKIDNTSEFFQENKVLSEEENKISDTTNNDPLLNKTF